MAAKLAVLIFLPFALASDGNLINNATYTEEWPPNGPTTDDCLAACGQFHGTGASIYKTYTSNNCYVAITQITKETFKGAVVSDACGSLVASYPRRNVTSEFRGTGSVDARTDAGGTLRITWGKQILPATEPVGVVTESTGSTGDYSVPLQNCSDALQEAFPKNKNQASSGTLSKLVGMCNATITSLNSGYIASPKASRGGQDILTVPANCNAQNLCRSFINSSIADHQGVIWGELVTFQLAN